MARLWLTLAIFGWVMYDSDLMSLFELTFYDRILFSALMPTIKKVAGTWYLLRMSRILVV